MAGNGGDRQPERVGPATNGIGRNIAPALGEYLFDVAQGGGEAEVDPHRQADSIGRKAMAFE